MTGIPVKAQAKSMYKHTWHLHSTLQDRIAACMAHQPWLQPTQLYRPYAAINVKVGHKHTWDLQCSSGSASSQVSGGGSTSHVLGSTNPTLQRVLTVCSKVLCVRTHILLWKLPQQLLCSLLQHAFYISSRSSRLRLSMSCVHFGSACPAHATEDKKWLAYILLLHLVLCNMRCGGSTSAEMEEARHAW